MNSWKSIGSLSRDQLRDFQNKKLHEFINTQVYPFSAYYRRLFDQNNIDPKSIRSVEDLSKIPFSSKVDFFDDEDTSQKTKDFILQPDEQKIKQSWPASKLIPMAAEKIFKGSLAVKDKLEWEYRPVFMTFTTGTTKKPVSFLYSNYDIERNLRTAGERMLDVFGIDPSERLVNMFPYAPHLAFWQVVFGGLASNVLILSTGGGKVMGTEGNIAAIMKMQPSVILGVPSYVYHVIRQAKEKGLKFPFLKKVVLGAAKVTEPYKQRLRTMLHDMEAEEVHVIGTYGFTEARSAWGEAPVKSGDSTGYYLYPDKEIFEVVDPETGEVKGEGEDGEVVYTPLDCRGSVVLRYRTGDYVKGGITHEPCPHTGLTVPRLSSDIVRLSDIKDLNLSKVKGQLVNLNHFIACLNEFDTIKEWQLEIRKKDNDPHEVDELVVYISGDNCSEEVQKGIHDRIATVTEISPNEIIELPFDEIVQRLELETASKEKRIIDNRPKG